MVVYSAKGAARFFRRKIIADNKSQTAVILRRSRGTMTRGRGGEEETKDRWVGEMIQADEKRETMEAMENRRKGDGTEG